MLDQEEILLHAHTERRSVRPWPREQGIHVYRAWLRKHWTSIRLYLERTSLDELPGQQLVARLQRLLSVDDTA